MSQPQSQPLEDGSDVMDIEETSPPESEVTDELQRLQEENARLRTRYAESKQASYRREAVGLASVGIISGIVGVVLPAAQQVLFSIAAIGLFAGVLTWFLTPEQFIPADVGRDVYSPLAENEDSIASQLGLSSTQVYLTTSDGPRVFVPKRSSYELPPEDALTIPFVIGEDESTTGLSFHPSATRLLNEFEATHQGPLPTNPSELATHLVEGLTEGFELAGGVKVDVDASTGRATFEISTVQFGPISQFDHPVRSFLALGMADGLAQPVETEWVTKENGETTITIRWEETEVEENSAA